MYRIGGLLSLFRLNQTIVPLHYNSIPSLLFSRRRQPIISSVAYSSRDKKERKDGPSPPPSSNSQSVGRYESQYFDNDLQDPFDESSSEREEEEKSEEHSEDEDVPDSEEEEFPEDENELFSESSDDEEDEEDGGFNEDDIHFSEDEENEDGSDSEDDLESPQSQRDQEIQELYDEIPSRFQSFATAQADIALEDLPDSLLDPIPVSRKLPPNHPFRLSHQQEQDAQEILKMLDEDRKSVV